MNRSKYLPCGEIINTHGVKGALKARSDCDSPEILAALPYVSADPNGEKIYNIVSASIQKSFVLLTFEGVNDLEDAIALKGKVIYAAREELMKFMEEGDRFIADLIGLPVLHADSKEEIGVLKDVINRGASDIYVIDTANGEKMMPAVDEFVISITDEEIYVRPIPGMLD